MMKIAFWIGGGGGASIPSGDRDVFGLDELVGAGLASGAYDAADVATVREPRFEYRFAATKRARQQLRRGGVIIANMGEEDRHSLRVAQAGQGLGNQLVEQLVRAVAAVLPNDCAASCGKVGG